MGLPYGVRRKLDKTYESYHRTFMIRLGPGPSYDLFHPIPKFFKRKRYQSYRRSTKNLQAVIGDVQEGHRTTRAMGMGWSFSKVAISRDSITTLRKLNLAFIPEAQDFVQAHTSPDNYRFVQCGLRVKQVNKHLEQESNPPKSLPISGASHGQTLVGAFSTATHGSGILYGPTPEMVKGLHIVSQSDWHFWITAEDGPEVSATFLGNIGNPEVLRDTALFNAAKVGIGAFGFIHGALVQVEDIYLLDQWKQYVPWTGALEQAITDQDYSGLYDPDPKKSYLKYPPKTDSRSPEDKPLFHFEMKINPYRFWTDPDDHGVFLRTMHKVPYQGGYKRKPAPFVRGEEPAAGSQPEGSKVAGDLLSLVTTLASREENALDVDVFQNVVGEFLDHTYRKEMNMIVPEMGTVGETFDIEEFTLPVIRPRIWDASYMMDRRDALRALDLCKDIMLKPPYTLNGKPQWVAVFELRFVQATDATLGMTRFENTCIFEIVGIQKNVNLSLARDVAERFQAEGLRFAMHWGKENRVVTKEMLRWNYEEEGRDRIKEWMQQRSKIMREQDQWVFNNDLMSRFGIDDYVPLSE